MYLYYVSFAHMTPAGLSVESFEYRTPLSIRTGEDIDQITKMIRSWGRSDVTVLGFSRLEDSYTVR
ncbi:hypothetical protein [Plantactinospora sp. BB1]|uniref:hypothetical protein n=1 Tax=Plantactinospora sp. BB1 TaxID=2071627 RepID=UPI000D15ACB7|nr:hypothetical protein [Plantactinospora sp. BB1]AVT38020.1 hypothetical protein C6W10_18000 [Plantactinospora sp. BB1]